MAIPLQSRQISPPRAHRNCAFAIGAKGMGISFVVQAIASHITILIGYAVMPKSAKSRVPSASPDLFKPASEYAQAISQVLTEAQQKLQDIHSASCAASFGDAMLEIFHGFEPGAMSHVLWHMPSWYQAQAAHQVQSMLDTCNVLQHSQRQVLESMADAVSQYSQQGATAMAQMNASLFDRRVVAELPDFPERRAAMDHAPAAAAAAQKA